ncbi:MAG: S8/S53 family peptidase [Clostridiales bacterium]|nr:MAG: S8/S53 family peptidase [Clostridiales bacterium]
MIDTGINASHELFNGVLCDEGLWYNAIEKKRGRDYINDNCYNGNLIGHGTHVAGIVAQEIKKYGLEDYIKILPVKAGDSKGSFKDVAVVNAISYVGNLATQDKTIVINMSLTSYYWGKNSDVDDAVQSAVREGVIVCAAAGNDRKNSASSGYSLGSPACLENVIGVMNYGEGLIPAPKSNYGTAYDIAAPGQEIISAAKSDETEPYCIKRHEHGNAFRILCGGGAGNKIQQEIGNRLRRDDKYSCRCDRHSIVRKRCLYRKKT